MIDAFIIDRLRQQRQKPAQENVLRIPARSDDPRRPPPTSTEPVEEQNRGVAIIDFSI